MKNFLKKYRRWLGIIGSFVALSIAAIYLIITPREAIDTEGVQKVIIMYSHSLGWVLLGVASLLWGLNRNNLWAKYLSYSALLVYVIFIVTLVSSS